MCKKASPSDDEMIAMAKEDRPISRDELGISPSTTSDGLQYLSEGFDFLQFIGGELETMNWLRKIFKQEDVCDETSLSQPKLSNAINLKEKFKTERSSQKENSWAKIRALIENAMKEGKGYVIINSDTYKNIPLRELSHEIKKAKYKLRDNTCGLCVKYCYNMGYSLIICWE